MGLVHEQGKPRGDHAIDARAKKQIVDYEKGIKGTKIATAGWMLLRMMQHAEALTPNRLLKQSGVNSNRS